jgi:hypothetical protein
MHRWRALLELRSASETFHSGGQGFRANRSLFTCWYMGEGFSTRLDKALRRRRPSNVFSKAFLRGRQGLLKGGEAGRQRC